MHGELISWKSMMAGPSLRFANVFEFRELHSIESLYGIFCIPSKLDNS